MDPLNRPWVVLALLASGVAGCTSEVPPGGFLADTSQLRQTHGAQAMYVHFDPQHPLAAYDGFILDALVIRLPPQRSLPVALRERAAIEPAYREAVTAALTQDHRFRRAESAGPGVLRLRAAVTDRFQSDDELNEHTPPAPGFATIELEAVDSISNRRVFAIIDPTFAMRDGGGEYTTAPAAFTRFARRLRLRLDQAAYEATRR